MNPPSIITFVPVVWPLAGLARKATDLAISSPAPNLPNGIYFLKVRDGQDRLAIKRIISIKK